MKLNEIKSLDPQQVENWLQEYGIVYGNDNYGCHRTFNPAMVKGNYVDFENGFLTCTGRQMQPLPDFPFPHQNLSGYSCRNRVLASWTPFKLNPHMKIVQLRNCKLPDDPIPNIGVVYDVEFTFTKKTPISHLFADHHDALILVQVKPLFNITKYENDSIQLNIGTNVPNVYTSVFDLQEGMVEAGLGDWL